MLMNHTHSLGGKGARKDDVRSATQRGSRLVSRVAQVVAPRIRTATPEVEVVTPTVQIVKPATQPEKQQAATSTISERAAPTGDGASQSTQVVMDAPGTKKAAILRSLVFVTSECAPWSKTGGLGDVMGSLPKALAARGHRVMVVSPRYANYPDAIDTGKRHLVMGSEVGYFHHINQGVDYVFVDHPSLPRPGGIYSDAFGAYGDNQFRYTLLTVAALEAPLVLPLGEQGLYGQEVVFMANDWHTSLIPVYLAAKYRAYGTYMGARSILAIHNLKHQGVFPPGTYGMLDLPGDWYKALEWQYPPHQRQGAFAEEGRSVNYMKAGISTADRVLTVSSGYADEIKTWLGGWGMDGLLCDRGFVLNGITNGIDTDVWDPSSDPHLAMNYDETNFEAGKAACKKAMQEELALPIDAEAPLVVFIGRLDNQKGADILLEAVQEMLPNGRFQLVCLGTGDKSLESGLQWLENAYRDKVRCWVGFNEPLSHRLTAAADIVLMPSRFEPCGLNQLYAMRYGAVPVAHKTGGLKDTVIDFDPWTNKGTGWTYTSCDATGLTWALGLALQTWFLHRDDFRKLQVRGMQRDSSWDTAAQQYEQCITWAVTDQPYCK